MKSEVKKEILSALQHHPLFQGLDEKFLQFLASIAQLRTFEPGHMILREGEEAVEFYVILSGSVSLEFFLTPNALFTLEELSEGEVLGWSWLFPPYRWHLSARARNQVQAIAIDAQKLRKKLTQDPRLGLELTQRFSRIIFDRLRASREQLAQLMLQMRSREKS